MTAPRYTELADELEQYGFVPTEDVRDEFVVLLRHAADLEREVAELRERLDADPNPDAGTAQVTIYGPQGAAIFTIPTRPIVAP